MFYGMTNVFSFLNVNTNKVYKYTRKFVFFRISKSFLQVDSREGGGVYAHPACHLETFKTVQGHCLIFL